MILELCESVRQFLYEKNAPPKGSFHDDMLKNKEIAKNEMKVWFPSIFLLFVRYFCSKGLRFFHFFIWYVYGHRLV